MTPSNFVFVIAFTCRITVLHLKLLELAKLNADWNFESIASSDWKSWFSQDPKDAVFFQLQTKSLFVFQYSLAVGEWLVTDISLPCWLICSRNKPHKDVSVGYRCTSCVCCKETGWRPSAFDHSKGLPMSLLINTLAWLIAIRLCLFKLKFHAIYLFMEKNTPYRRNVKYLEEG